MENQLIPDEFIMNKIYYFRGHKTMLASNLPELYNIETRVLNQSVKRNLKRLPPDFMFQLSENEYSSLTSQFVMSKKGRGGRRVLPFAFTEHGVLMLSSVLNSDRSKYSSNEDLYEDSPNAFQQYRIETRNRKN